MNFYKILWCVVVCTSVLMVNLLPAEDSVSKDIYVSSPHENVRSGPNGKKLGSLLQGTPLKEIERKGGWIRVQMEGWIWDRSVSEEAPGPVKTNKSSLIIESWRWLNENASHGIKIEGVVKNMSDTAFEDVKMTIFARDANGNFLGSTGAELKPSLIPAGVSSMFSAYINDAVCSTTTIDITYRLDIQ